MPTASFHRALVALVAMATVSGAFVPTKMRTHRLSKTSVKSEAFEGSLDGKLGISLAPAAPGPLAEVLPGVCLPEGVEPPRPHNAYTNKQVGKFKKQVPAIFALIGQRKTSLAAAQSLMLGINGIPGTVPSETYRYFGNKKDHAKGLTILLKSNPFFASALTDTEDGFELKSYDPAEKSPSLFLQTLGTLNGVGHRVNFQFDKKMEMTSFAVFDDITGGEIQGDLDRDYWASSAIYNVIFYASCIHANIHVLHYLMTAAFQVASEDFEEMNEWATDYAKNIAEKYEAVGQLLITNPGPNQLPIITGSAGFGSSQAVRPILKGMLDMWGEAPRAKDFLENMVKLDHEKMKHAGILVEFKKHSDIVDNFACGTTEALRGINHSKFATAEARLKAYLKNCGSFKSSIDTIEEWVELMSVTGLTHAGTLSYTRMMGVADIARWRNINNPAWDFADINLVTAGLGTIVGMQPGRHVMSATTNMFGFAPALQKVLHKYDEEATERKEKYMDELIKSEDFDDFGWILSDYCPDNFDGKQLTIATYI